VHDGSEDVVGLFPQSSITGARTNRSKAAKVDGTNWFVDNYESDEYTDSGSAARFFYCAKSSRSERGEGNDHPTVKPLALMKWLCTLTRTPTGGTVLDPFMGSGTTGLACLAVGRPFIGIEQDEHACEIAATRLGRLLPLDTSTPIE
jgi:DNA modification methylase